MSEAPKTIGPYEVIEQITKGKSVRVYKARDVASNRTVALKVLPLGAPDDEERLERLREEAEAVAALDHPNVVRVLGQGEDGERFYFATEPLEGTSLDKVLKRRRLTLHEAFLIFKGVAAGLRAAHLQGIVHRGLSPRNILVSDDFSTVKVADFGISRAATLTSDRGTLTSTSVGRGTIHYIAPEQAADPASGDERSDVYSLGVLLYEMLTGTVPIGRFNLPSRVNSEVPADLDALVLKCLEGNPRNRYASVDAILADVVRLEDRLGLSLMSELRGIGRRLRRRGSSPSRSRKGIVVGGVVVIVLLLLVVALMRVRDRPDAAGVRAGAASSTGAPETGTSETAAGEPSEKALAEGGEGAVSGPETSSDPSSSGATGVAATSRVEAPEPSPSATETAPAVDPLVEARQIFDIASEKARNGLLDQAISDIDVILERYAGTEVAAEALFLRGRVEEAQKRFEAAMGTYTEIGARFDAPEVRAKARYRFARAVLDGGVANGERLALGVFDEIARAYPQTEYAAKALASKAALEANSKLRVDSEEFGRKVPAAFLTSLELIERYPDDPTSEPAFWIVATELEDLKQWERAAETFWELASRFPSTELDAWWRAGQLLDRRLDDTERALEAYRRVPQSSEHYEDAQKRINRLTR